MTINESLVFFEKYPKIKRKLQTLIDVGLGYINLVNHQLNYQVEKLKG